MPPPSPLAVATSAVNRLVKEEASYHKELEQQHARLAKVEAEVGDENKEYIVRQERRAIEETKAIFPPLRKRIGEAIEKLEGQLEAAQEEGNESTVEEITKAKDAVAAGKKSYSEAT